MADVVVWADLPVRDLERASKFYEALTGLPVLRMPGEDTIAVVTTPADEGPAVSIDLYVGGTPSHDGPTVYFSPAGGMDAALERALGAGGTLLQPKQFMGDMVGWIAFLEDTEGNRIGLQEPGA